MVRQSALRALLASIVVIGCEQGAPPSVDGGIDGAPDAGTDAEAPDAGIAGMLDPTSVPQFVQPLVIPPALDPDRRHAGRTEYSIAVRQIVQRVLPEPLPETTVWAYGRPADPETFSYPGHTIEARTGETVRVEWRNELLDAEGRYLSHLLPVDQTVHWASPRGPIDHEGSDPTHYLGPVPIVTHLHGGHVPSISDGNPEAWFLADAIDLPAGYTSHGTVYASIVPAEPGAAIFDYPLDQRAATLWYHDHTLGMTRLNVYAGLAGFFVIRDDEEDALGLPGPAPMPGDAAGLRYHEIPIVVQDRSFREDGSLFYPGSRTYFDGFEGPFEPDSEVPPTWNPEFFGDVIVVNGRAWPYLEVEPRLYRLRILNGSNTRVFVLRPDRAEVVMTQIGSDGGLLPDAPIVRDELRLAPAERADVLFDLRALSPGERVVLLNLGPDEPYGGPDAAQDPADPATTGRVMELRVVADAGEGEPGAVPTTLPAIAPLTASTSPRDLTLHELTYAPADIPREATLGTLADGHLDWDELVTERPLEGDTEIWRLANTTEDAHPVHLHLVMFRVLDRTPFDAEALLEAQDAYLAGMGPAPVLEDYFTGPPIEPAPEERGWKDTVVASPDEVTRLIATFDLPGRYVWHCHILEHEDNEMMRPFVVTPRP